MRAFVTGTRGIPGIMGGVETHCEQLMPRLAALGADITVARRDKYVTDTLTEWQGVKLVDIASPDRKALEAIVHTWRALREAKRRGAELVHIHAIGPALLAPVARMMGLRVVFTHHGPDYDRDKWGRMAKMMLKTGERMGCRYANQVIVISRVIRDIVATRHGRTEGVNLIPNGVPAATHTDYPEYFAELGIEPGRYVLGMSRFVPEKNLHHLVEAFAKAAPKGYKLVLAGDADFEDDYSRQLKQLARDHGVVLTGFVRGRKLASLLSNAALYVLPSSHEGLPIALLEAMSYGLPVGVSAIPANLEVGLPESDYFPVGDTDALAALITAKLANPSKPSYDMSRYDWDTVARDTLEVYRRAVGR